jgi:hypothetical protein
MVIQVAAVVAALLLHQPIRPMLLPVAVEAVRMACMPL